MNIPSDPPPEGDPRDDSTPHAGDSLPEPPARETGSSGGTRSANETMADAGTETETETDRGSARHHVNPARMEVRVRRIALLGLILVPVVYFVVQSLR